MKRLAVFLVVVGLAASAWAQWNSWQGLQPSRANYMARTSGALPQDAEIVFQHNLNDATAQVGSYTYTRSGSVTYPSATSSLSEVSANVLPAGAVRWRGTESLKGAYFSGAVVNKLLYSEDVTNGAWTLSGTAARSSNTATDPMGTTLADTVSASDSTSYIEQCTSTVGGSTQWDFSVHMISTSGTLNVKIQVLDGAGQGNHEIVSVGTTYDRYDVPALFRSSSANVCVRIYPGNTSNLRVWGAQLEQWTGTGRRNRWAVANQYVRTTSAEATSGSARYEIPNATLTQVATTGTICSWILNPIDPIDIDPNNPQYLWSVNGETFGLSFPARYSYILWINGGIAAQGPNAGLDAAMYGLPSNQWVHLCATWNTGTDDYHVYYDSVDVTGSTTAAATIAMSTHTMNVGGYDSAQSHLAADSILSQFVMWKVALTAEEVEAVYDSKAPSATRTAIGTGKIFEVNLGTSPIPVVGDTHFDWNAKGGGTFYYPDTTTSLNASDTVNSYPAPCYPLNGYNKGGFCFVSEQTNYILQSEAPATTWTQVGTPTFVGNDLATYGDLSLGLLATDAANEGIQQSIGVAAASTSWTASVYVKTSSGTVNGEIVLEGDSGGTPESTTTCTFAATATMSRPSCFKVFTGSATGNVRMKVLIKDSGATAYLLGGMMLERANNGAGTTYYKVGSNYIKTTTAAASNYWDQIHYRGVDSFNVAKGTAIAWAFLWDADITNDFIVANGPTLIAAPGQHANFYWHQGNADQAIFDYGNNSPVVEYTGLAMTRGVWYQHAITWDTTVEPAVFKIYKDGAEIASDTAAAAAYRKLTQRKFIVGGDYVFASMDYWQGAIDHMEVWGAPNPTAISDDWTARRASYGR